MSTYLKNIAIVGAGGNSGSHMTRSILETGKHTITALTRKDSNTPLPGGVVVKHIDYDDPSTIVAALQGIDALVITMSTFAPAGQQDVLLEAAAKAGVPWVLPNEWAPDSAHPGLVADVAPLDKLPQARKKIEALGVSAWIAVSCGFWYEWSLSIPAAFGIDLKEKSAVLFDEGEVKMTVSTWAQVGRGVAALLSLAVAELEEFRNGHVYVGSFTVSQKDMLDSAIRVTGTKMEEWKITHEPAKERYEKAREGMMKGDQMAFVRQMYTRVFYDDASGNIEKRCGLQNDRLGLPKEDIDEATKVAVKRREESTWG